MDLTPKHWFLALAAVFGLVARVTFVQARTATQHKPGRRPPALPLSLPLIGHLSQFLWDPERLMARASSPFGPTTPVRIRVLDRRMTILNGADSIAALFKGSRAVSSEPWLVRTLIHAFGVLDKDAHVYYNDNTGVGVKPVPGSNTIPPEHRIFRLVYQSVHEGLSGTRLEDTERRLVANFAAQISHADVGQEGWTAVPDLHGSLIRKMCFVATTTSWFGSRIFDAAPDLEPDFWRFESHLPCLFKEVPQWLSPASYRARAKMQDNMRRWHELAHAEYDITKGTDDPRNWEPTFGSRLLRNRHAFFRNMPLSKETNAADDLGLLWAANANVIPGIAWMILEVLQRPALLAQVRALSAPYLDLFSDTSAPRVDIERLCREPLLQSIYAEVLRRHNAAVLARVPLTDDFTLGGWRFDKGDPIVVSSYNAAHEPSVWNEGTLRDPHPVHEFWPERFIVDPQDGASGPVRRDPRPDAAPEKGGDAPYFSLEGTAGSWNPYGGGFRMCPGRHFAKKEMIITMVMFLASFDVDLMPMEDWVQDDFDYFMCGVMPPKGPVAARVQRRNKMSVA